MVRLGFIMASSPSMSLRLPSWALSDVPRSRTNLQGIRVLCYLDLGKLFSVTAKKGVENCCGGSEVGTIWSPLLEMPMSLCLGAFVYHSTPRQRLGKSAIAGQTWHISLLMLEFKFPKSKTVPALFYATPQA